MSVSLCLEVSLHIKSTQEALRHFGFRDSVCVGLSRLIDYIRPINNQNKSIG